MKQLEQKKCKTESVFKDVLIPYFITMNTKSFMSNLNSKTIFQNTEYLFIFTYIYKHRR